MAKNKKPVVDEVKVIEPIVDETPKVEEPQYNLVVIKEFYDKYDHSKLYKIGDRLLNLTKERYEELKANVHNLVEDLK